MREITHQLSLFETDLPNDLASSIRPVSLPMSEGEVIACEIINVQLACLYQSLINFQIGQLSRGELQVHLQTHASGMDEANEILQLVPNDVQSESDSGHEVLREPSVA